MTYDHHIEELHGKSINLVLTTQFKTNLIGIYLLVPLDERHVSAQVLALKTMIKATRDLSPKAFNQKLDDLYGAYLQADVQKMGEYLSLQIKMIFPNDLHLPDPILEEATGLLFDLFKNPVSESLDFEALFALEKHAFGDLLRSKFDDKGQLAYDRLIEHMYKGQAFALNRLGTLEGLEAVTPEDVKIQIQAFKHLHHHIRFVGNVKKERLIKAIDRFGFQTDQAFGIRISPLSVDDARAETYYDHDQVHQTKLSLGYALDIDSSKPYYALVLWNHLLGGDGSALLFKDIREKEGLCYSIYSHIDKFKKHLIVQCGIDHEAITPVRERVEHNLQTMLETLPDDQAWQLGKKALIRQYKAIQDSPSGYMNFMYSQALAGLPVSVDEIIAEIDALTKEDLLGVVKGVVLSVAYALTSDKGGPIHD